MATITKRRNPSGETVYRVQVRVSKKGYPAFNESRTFSKKALAVEWGKKREAEIEADPELLFKRGKVKMMTLSEAMRKYLNETLGAGRSKKMGLRFLMEFPIGGRVVLQQGFAGFGLYLHGVNFRRHCFLFFQWQRADPVFIVLRLRRAQ